MLTIDYNFLTGMMFGIAHVSPDEDDEYDWIVVLGLGPFQILLIKSSVA